MAPVDFQNCYIDDLVSDNYFGGIGPLLVQDLNPVGLVYGVLGSEEIAVRQ